MPAFTQYVGVDYSGAKTPTASLRGLRAYVTDGPHNLPKEEQPPLGQLKHWTRSGIAAWLVQILTTESPILVGIDHGFSFPIYYFERCPVSRDWRSFLDDFQEHWPTDDEMVWVRDALRGDVGRAADRMGDPTWFRITKRKSNKRAKSVFNFGQKQGCVAFSTHAGIPWLRYIRRHAGVHVHFWPFDGWSIREGCSVVAEVYPALWSHEFERQDGRTGDQHDAHCIAAWLSRADHENSLNNFLNPLLTPAERAIADVEGWILGVT